MQLDSLQLPYRNRLLAALSADALREIAPHLTRIDLPRNLTLHGAGQMVETAYFLEDGVCSVVAAMDNGTTVEVGIIGIDGFVGTAVLLNTDHSPNRCFMQIQGYGFQIKARTLAELSNAHLSLRLCLLRSVQGLLTQTAQTAACNRVHELPFRLARWLLMCRDRVQTDQIAITQEFLAAMLGTRRSTVTVAASRLQKAGYIAYTRGHVTILDRDGLAAAACECYQTVHDEAVRLHLLE